MEHLWSPWRMQYILSNKEENGCVFCEVLNQEDNVENLVISRCEFAYVILNKFPYNTGHTLIIPYQHAESYEELTPACRAEMMELINKTTAVLRCVYQPQGFNIGANIGAAAGAGIAPHLHFHILPRWEGDTNFLTTVAQTRIIPEDLADSYSRILAVWAAQS